MGQTQVPYGAQLLNRIVKAFQLHEDVNLRAQEAIGKSSQRFFAQGKNVRNPCGPICTFGWILVGTPLCSCGASRTAQFFQPLLFPTPLPKTVAQLITAAMHCHANEWDRVIRPAIADEPSLARAMVRLGTLDLAYKTAWLRQHLALPRPDTSTVPAWAESERYGELLTTIVDLMRPKGLSFEDVAARANISTETLTNWRRGEHRPSNEHLRTLIAVLLPQECHAYALGTLTRHYALADLAAELRGVFGEAFVLDLARVFQDVVACLMQRDRRAWPNTIVADFVALFRLGLSSWLLSDNDFLAIADHHAKHWREDIMSAKALWQAPIHRESPDRETDLLNWLSLVHDAPSITRHRRASPRRSG